MTTHRTGFLVATLVDAAAFWERRRVRYNAVLGAVVIAWLVTTWPHFRPALVPGSILPLLALALVANACYSAAYLGEFALAAMTVTRTRAWRRARAGVWLVGTLFAALLACYWIADEIYPSFG